MSKEKNVQPVEPKKEKEHTSVLESIRKRTGLLVGIVGLALLIFVLESLLSSGQSIFGGDEMSSIGRINGKKIDRNEFLMKLENQLNIMRQQRQSNDIDDQTRAQVVDFIWKQYVNDLVIKPQFELLGINVGDDEVYERVVVNPVQTISQRLIDQKTGKIYEQLAGPDGNLDPVKWRQFVQNASGEQEAFIKELEEGVRTSRQLEKYSAIIKKGLYVTTSEAKEAVKLSGNKLDFSLVLKRYDAVSDSAYKVTDADIQKYYNDNSYQFSNDETSRKVEYVAFNVTPSPEDLIAIEKDAQRAAEEFKGKNVSDDSVFIAQESENNNIMIQDFSRKTMIVRDSSIFTAAPGTVFGPYNEGAYFKIYKLQGIRNIADSARVRHILVATIDVATQQPKKPREQAKREADSLLTLIKDKKMTFDTLVKTVTDDLGSKDKGGDYGWFGEEERFVEPFKNAGLLGTKGNISIVETQFGFHIIEVLDVSAGKHNSYKVAQIFKLIAPSDETNQRIFAQANEFGGKNNTADLFDKAVDAQKLSKRIADNIKESDRQLPGIDQAKELVRWTYTANKGDVAVFSLPDKHIVAKLSSIKNKGILPLEDVKDEVAEKARLQKKSEAFIAEFKAAGTTNVNELGPKIGIEVKKLEKIPASSNSVEGVKDLILIGTVAGLKPGQTSKIIAGEAGVFMANLTEFEAAATMSDYKGKQREMEQEYAGRSDYDVINVLNEKAEIEDHKSRIE